VSLELLHNRVTAISTQRVKITSYNDQYRSETSEVWEKVPRDKFRANIAKYEQITVNTPEFKNAIIFDVDDPDKFQIPDIAPYWQTYNINNEKHHVGYLLKDPIYTKSEKQKEWYNTTIRPMIVKTAWLINADGNYKNTTTKNPFNTNIYTTKEVGNTLNNVWELLGQYNDDINSLNELAIHRKADGRYLSQKYKEYISELIEHSQMNTKLLFSDRNQFKKVMHLKASMITNDGGLKSTKGELESLKSICNDVISYSIEWANKVSEAQSKRSKIANKTRWGNQVDENKQNITNAIIDLLARNKKPTLANISLCVSLKEKTLKNSYSQYIKSERRRLFVKL